MLPQDSTSDLTVRKSWETAFVGPYKLRAGWRVLIFVAVFVSLMFGTIPLQRLLFRKLGQGFNASNVAIGEGFTFLLLLIVTRVMAKFEHRKIGDYGLPARGFLGRNFWSGALWGFGMLSCVIALMVAVHAYAFGGLALSPPAILKYGLLWALAFLCVGLFEEFSFRGYVQYTLTWGTGFWPAAATTSLLFALAHTGNPGENWVGVAEIVLIALFLCIALRRTGTLWFAIGWHMAFDWGESFFYSTPNSGIHATGHLLNASLMGSKWLSGGTVGPEASLFDLIVTIAGILLLIKLYPEAKYPTVLPEPAKLVAAPPASTFEMPAPAHE